MTKLVSRVGLKPLSIAIGIIAILHFVGFFGLRSNYQDTFAALTPLNLLIAFLLMIPFKNGTWKKFLLFLGFSFTVGMVIEIIGVQTGFPFGAYYYTKLLSLSVLGVPLLIGINWFMLSYGILGLVNKVGSQLHYVVKTSIAALLMTFMDVLIEPFAIQHKLWVWDSSEVPLENYLSWFVISWVIFFIGFKIYPEKYNTMALFTIIIFFMFFGLNFLVA